MSERMETIFMKVEEKRCKMEPTTLYLLGLLELLFLYEIDKIEIKSHNVMVHAACKFNKWMEN